MFHSLVLVYFNNTEIDFSLSSCALDPTLQITPTDDGQLLSFELFAYPELPDSDTWLACDTVACFPDQACGVCIDEHIGKTNNRNEL